MISMKQGMASLALTLSGSFLPLMHGEMVAIMMMLTQKEGRRVIMVWWIHMLTTQFHFLM